MKVNSVSPDGGRVLLQVDGNVVTIRGEIDQISPKLFLGPFLEEVHLAARRGGVARSAGGHPRAPLSQLVGGQGAHRVGAQAQSPAAGKKYVLDFIYDSSILWQRVTMPTLSQLDSDFVVLSDRSKSPLRNG
jgi:hypothetical protein